MAWTRGCISFLKGLNRGSPGVYNASLLKAFRRTVEEGRSTFVIVDAPNPRVEDLKPYWDAGQVWTVFILHGSAR